MLTGLAQGAANMAKYLADKANGIISIGYTIVSDAIAIYDMFSKNPCNILMNIFESLATAAIDSAAFISLCPWYRAGLDLPPGQPSQSPHQCSSRWLTGC